MRIAIPVLVFGIALSCGPAFADGDGTGAMGQLDNATSGNQTLQQTYGDQGHDEKCPEACPSGNANVPEPPPPTPVDNGNGN
jgi:hypothetical protein